MQDCYAGPGQLGPGRVLIDSFGVFPVRWWLFFLYLFVLVNSTGGVLLTAPLNQW